MAKTTHSTTTRRAVLAGAAVLPALAIVPATALAAADPIFAAIEEHRRLRAISDAAFAAVPKGVGLTDEVAKAEEYAGDRNVEGWDHFEKILAMTPPTVAGCIAMLHYLGWFMQHCENPCAPFRGWADELSKPAETLLSRIAAALDGKAVQS